MTRIIDGVHDRFLVFRNQHLIETGRIQSPARERCGIAYYIADIATDFMWYSDVLPFAVRRDSDHVRWLDSGSRYSSRNNQMFFCSGFDRPSSLEVVLEETCRWFPNMREMRVERQISPDSEVDDVLRHWLQSSLNVWRQVHG